MNLKVSLCKVYLAFLSVKTVIFSENAKLTLIADYVYLDFK